MLNEIMTDKDQTNLRPIALAALNDLPQK